ncbi:MAG: hypothetical protein ACFFCW_32040 [Candidatus Hodarchaeota archaeon]
MVFTLFEKYLNDYAKNFFWISEIFYSFEFMRNILSSVSISRFETIYAGATCLHSMMRKVETERSITGFHLFRKVLETTSEEYPVGAKSISDLGTHGAAVMDSFCT